MSKTNNGQHSLWGTPEPKIWTQTPAKVELNYDYTLMEGDCIDRLYELEEGSVQLVFTSPPYFNARPEYGWYDNFQLYSHMLFNAISGMHRALAEGRFIIINVSPILIKREKRSESSRRIPIQHEIHRILSIFDFEFIDDIIWKKPAGAGAGRGRRFSIDRQPLQYKPESVTEYLMVYRKKSDKLIDWNIRQYPEAVVRNSLIDDGYEFTNVWEINPVANEKHPAVFPRELALKVISYYSYMGDTILDPFAGSGTTGLAAAQLNRSFVLIEQSESYFEDLVTTFTSALGDQANLLRVDRRI